MIQYDQIKKTMKALKQAEENYAAYKNDNLYSPDVEETMNEIRETAERMNLIMNLKNNKDDENVF
jgi:hypothetical protein